MKTQQDLDNFLAALTELSRAHGFEISACGCCGSPHVYPFDMYDRGEGFERGHYVANSYPASKDHLTPGTIAATELSWVSE